MYQHLSMTVLILRSLRKEKTTKDTRGVVGRRCTRENEHPRKRAPDHTMPARSHMQAKFSSQTQPHKCGPTADWGSQLTALCTRSTFCTRWSTPVAAVAAFTLQIWLVLRVSQTTSPDQDLPRRETSDLLTRLFCLILSSTFCFSKEKHTIWPSNICSWKLHTRGAGATCKTFASTGIFFAFYPAFSLQFRALPHTTKWKNWNKIFDYKLRNW